MKTAFMMDTAGVVTNSIVLADDTDPAAFGAVLGPENVGIGWTFDGTNWTSPAESVSPPPSQSDLFEQARQLVEKHVNEVARTRRYTDAVSCASYVASTNATWSAEATTFVAWRDAVWALVYGLEDKALAGEIGTVPTADELIASLPAIAWPD